MSALASRAERLKFARLLDRDEESLTWLDDLDPDAVRAVRERVTDLLFEQGSGQFGLLLQASRLLPKPVVASIAQAVFPPVLSAQMAGLLDPDYAAGLIGHFRTDYLADLSGAADPRRVDHVIPHLPDDVLIAVSRELVEREDFLTAGRLVGLAPPRLFPVLVDDVATDRQLIEISFFLEHTEALDPIVDCVGDDRIAAMMTIATEEGRWPEALSLSTHVGEANAARIARVAARQPTATLEALVDATVAQGLWEEVLDLLGHVDDDEMDRIAAVERLVDPAVVRAAASAADSEARRQTLARLAAAMTEDRQRAVAAALEDVPAERAAELIATADFLGLLADLDWLRPDGTR